MKRKLRLFAILALPLAMACEEKTETEVRALESKLTAPSWALQAARGLGEDFVATIECRDRYTYAISSKNDTNSLYHVITRTNNDNQVADWVYIDPTAISLTMEGENLIRYSYSDWDTAYYSVLLTNFSMGRQSCSFNMVFAGMDMGTMNITMITDTNSAEDLGTLLGSDGNKLKQILRKIAKHIPSINITLANHSQVGDGNISVSGGRGGQLNDQDVASLCLAAGVQSAELCIKAGGKPLTTHSADHKSGCSFACL